MAALTESEILDCLEQEFRKAEEYCRNIAKFPLAGPNYHKLRGSVDLIEGCCRQLNVWRSDERWLPVGYQMAFLKARCGDWLRGHNPRKMFTHMADAMGRMHRMAQDMRHKKTGKRGDILLIGPPQRPQLLTA